MPYGTRFSVAVLLLLLAEHARTVSNSCALYSDAAHVRCLRGAEVLRTVTGSSEAWMLEFYSGWCGHCQRFAPTLSSLAEDMRRWSSVMRVGVVECTLAENRDVCTKTFGVQAFPTLKFFNPGEMRPVRAASTVVGARQRDEVERMILNHITAVPDRPDHWPSLQPLVSGALLELPASAWKPTVFVFESEAIPVLGKQLILDFSSVKPLLVSRVERENVELIKHYSVLELPSVAIEITKNDHHIISGALFKDPRREFRAAITAHISAKLSGGVAPQREGDDGLSPEHVRALEHKPSSPGSLTPTKVSSADVLGAISYALRVEVAIHSIVSGHEFTALLRFTHLLESAFSLALPAAASNLQQVRIKLELKQQSGFILRRDWKRITDTKLDPLLFPVDNVEWVNCRGSQPHFRGYPCGLWMLLHTVTVLTLPTRPRFAILPQHRVQTKEALGVLTSFIEGFFSCEDCREHFTRMAQGVSDGALRYHGDAVLWLWEVHNAVNRRLSNAISSDPLHPKALFPRHTVCPYCYRQTAAAAAAAAAAAVAATGSSPLVEPSWNNTRFENGKKLVPADLGDGHYYVWNKTAVFLYLCNFYQLNTSAPMTELLEAGWPQGARSTVDLRPPAKLGFSGVDTGLCFTSYLLCVLTLATLTYMVFRRKCRRLLPSRT